MRGYTVGNPCAGVLKDARVAPPDLLAVLGRIRIDLLGLSHPGECAPLAARLQEIMTDAEAMPLVEDVDCGFDGEADDYRFVRSVGLVVWTCPRCGHENEEDAPEPDPDAERQYALENP